MIDREIKDYQNEVLDNLRRINFKVSLLTTAAVSAAVVAVLTVVFMAFFK